MNDFVDIDELIAEYEQDPAKRERLKSARIRLAPLISQPGDGRYERLMRGEGPAREKAMDLNHYKQLVVRRDEVMQELERLDHEADPFRAELARLNMDLLRARVEIEKFDGKLDIAG